MELQKDASLKSYNTFGIEAKTKYLALISSIDDITQFKQTGLSNDNETFIIGGGSNLLFTRDFNGVLLHSEINTIELVSQDDNHIYIRCGSGVNWDYFVSYCVERNWAGIENLSDIPGNIGAAPVQNIGAYGVEAKDVIEKVEAIDYLSAKHIELSNTECCFSYRNSIFKTKEYQTVFITHVTFRLNKKAKLISHYGNLNEQLEKFNNPGIHELRQIIIKTRQSKLPPVEQLGSAGSFFKNPIIDESIANNLKSDYPELPVYDNGQRKKKLSAAWLIDNAGLKGIRHGGVGTYPKQALVIVNFDNASGKDIAEFSAFIQKSVYEKYAIKLEPEVIFK